MIINKRVLDYIEQIEGMYLDSKVIAILHEHNISYFRLYEILNNTTALRRRSAVRNDNQGLAGIYFWENKLNNNGYVGLSKNLGERLDSYFQPGTLRSALRQHESLISRALLKYGIENFRLFILHVVPGYNHDSITDRQYLSYLEGVYDGILKPVYNSAGTGRANSCLQVQDRPSLTNVICPIFDNYCLAPDKPGAFAERKAPPLFSFQQYRYELFKKGLYINNKGPLNDDDKLIVQG